MESALDYFVLAILVLCMRLWYSAGLERGRLLGRAREREELRTFYDHLLGRHWRCYVRLSTDAQKEFTELWQAEEAKHPPH